MTAFEEYPPKNLDTKFVVHAHFRKELSVHLDVRIQYAANALIGYTITNPFTYDKPFISFEKAKKIVEDEKEGLIKRINNPNEKFLAIPKEIQPIVWLKVEGEVEPGEIGATRFGRGAFVVVDQGKVEFGRLATFFREYWFNGDVFQGRCVARLIPGSITSDPELEDSKAITALVWLFWKTKATAPFVLSRTAINQGYIPPYDIPAMPKELVDQIPSKFRFWHHKNKFKRISVRALLVESNILKLTEIESTSDIMLKSTPEEAGQFSLMIQSFKGQFVIRFGASRTLFHLFLSPSDAKKSHHYVTISDPSKAFEAIALLQYPNVTKTLDKGFVAPSSYYNPTKDTDSFAEIITEGKYSMWETNSGYKLIQFKSPKLFGIFKLRPETPSSEIILLERIS